MSEAAAGGAVFRDPLALRPADASLRVRRTVTLAGVIARVRRMTHDTLEVVIRCAAEGALLAARAGQFVVLEIPGVAGPRPFSLARAPEDEAPGEHSLLIRCVPGGAFSQWLASGDRVGTALTLTGPLGAFTLDESNASMLCIAGGSGLSAIKAVVEHAANRQVARDCHLYYGVRTQADLCFSAELRALGRRWHPAHRYAVTEVLSEEPPNSGWTGARGLVTDLIATASRAAGSFDVRTTQAYLCGPPPMIAAAIAMLDVAGMPPAAIHCDVFEDARSPAPVIDNRLCVLCDECLLVKPLANCIVEAGQLQYDGLGNVEAVTPLSPARSAGLYYNSLVIDPAVCIRCYACVQACPHGAIAPGHSRRTMTLRQQP